MVWESRTAASVRVERARNPNTLQNSYFYSNTCRELREVSRRPCIRTFATESSVRRAGDQNPAAEDPSPATPGISASPTGNRRPSRRQQQQELLWGPSSATNTQPQQQDVLHFTHPPSSGLPPSPLQPLRRRQQQQQELPSDAPPFPPETEHAPAAPPPSSSATSHRPHPSRRQQQVLPWDTQQQQQLEPSNDTACDVTASIGPEDQMGLADLLAQQDEALLMRGGRHRNRQPVSSTTTPQSQPQPQPPGASDNSVSAGSRLEPGDVDSDAPWNEAGFAQGLWYGGGEDVYDLTLGWLKGQGQGEWPDGLGEGGAAKRALQQLKLQSRPQLPPSRPSSALPQTSQEASAAAVITTAAAVDTAPGPGAVSSTAGAAGDGNGSSSGGSGGDSGGRGSGSNGGSGTSGSRGVVLRLRRHGSGPATVRRRRIRLPLLQRPQPWPVKMLLEAQQLEQLGQQPGQPAEEGKGKQLQRLLGLQQHQEEEEHRREKQAWPQQAQEPGGLMRQAQPKTQILESQQQEKIQRQPQLRQQQQQQQQKVQKRQRAQLEQKRQGQAGTQTENQADKVFWGRHIRNTTSGSMVSEPCRTVVVHPDGTLWSPRTGDVGPLATQVLQRLLLLPRYREGANGGVAVAPPPARDLSTALENEGDGGGDGASNGGPPCHVLVAGSYQGYTTLRALSYAQGAMRLASYNLAAGRESSSWVPSLEPDPGRGPASAAGPVLCFTARDVSVQELRLYYEQTVRHGAGRRPELGPPPSLPPSPPFPWLSPQRKGTASLSAGLAAAGDVRLPKEPVVSGDTGLVRAAHVGGTLPGKALVGAAAEIAEPMGSQRRAARGAVGDLDRSNSALSQSPLPQQQQQRLKGWPEDTAHLEPRALVSVFLVQPPLLYGSGTADAVPAVADGCHRSRLPPLAVGATANVEGLACLLVNRLRNHGYCLMQALGRKASSRALAILSTASRALSLTGLGVLAFPCMSALGPSPRADMPLPPPPPPGAAATATAAAASHPVGGRHLRPRDTGCPPPLPATTANPTAGAGAPGLAAAGGSTEVPVAAAVAGVLDPVLLDKAPQLLLKVVLCEWDESGRPVVPELVGPAEPMATPGPATASALSSAPTTATAAVTRRPPYRQESELQGAGCYAVDLGPEAQPGAAAAATAAAGEPQPQRIAAASAPAAAVAATQHIERSGSSGTGDDHGRPAVRLAVVPPRRSDCCATATTITAIAAAAITGNGDGDHLELHLGGPDGPDTRTASEAVARAIAEGRRVVLAARCLGAVLRLPVVVFRAQGALRKLEHPRRRVLVFTLRRRSESQCGSRPQSQAHQQHSKGADQVLWQGSAIAVEARRALQERQQQHQGEAAQAEAAGEAADGDSVLVEVFRLPVSALQRHLDSLPRYPAEHITTQSVNRRLLPGDMSLSGGGYDSGGDSEGDGDGGDDQRYVQAAAAAAMQHLIQYGTATLAAISPGSRLTALLATASVSEGLMCSADLTVLVRVDPRVAPAEVPANSGQASVSQAPRPLPPKRYQLLLARMDPRVGRLQLLRPDDLMVHPTRGSGAG